MRKAKICGRGWVKKNAYGFGDKGCGRKYADLRSLYAQLKEEGIFKFPVENFGRFDQVTKVTAIAVALALYDAKVVYAKGQLQDVGILGTSISGATDANLAYFKDYIQAGRIMGRGNLFIYTLASSPLAEAAIHFGLAGPSLFLGYSQSAKQNILKHAELMLKAKEAKAMLAVEFSSKEATSYFIQEK